MEQIAPVTKCLCMILIVYLQILGLVAVSGIGMRRGARRGVHWEVSHLSGPLTRKRHQLSVHPVDRQNDYLSVHSVDTQSDYPFHGGVMDRIGGDQMHQGGFGGFPRRKSVTRDRMAHFGQFNSDTHGCEGIQNRNCSAQAQCGGCLGLYTCDRALGKCQLKGLSRRTDGFSQSLNNA